MTSEDEYARIKEDKWKKTVLLDSKELDPDRCEKCRRKIVDRELNCPWCGASGHRQRRWEWYYILAIVGGTILTIIASLYLT